MSRHLAAVFLAACLFAAPAGAGNNFGGTAVPSWSAVAEVSDLASVPPSMTPLYLLLTGAPDIRQLAVELKWTPNDLVGPCYYLVSMDSTATPCGWSSYPLDPPGVFDGDSAYTWRIGFSGPSRSCMTYLVGGEHCDGKPANFCLISVKTLDSNGLIDELAVIGNATILGGTEHGCPVVAQDIYPHVAVAGGENTFTIQGRDLAQDTQVALVDDGTAAPASTVTVSGDTTATATVTIPSGFIGALDVVVSTAQSSDTLRSRVVVADSSSGLPPVWQLDVTLVDGLPRASVTANEFVNPAYPPAFPVSSLVLRRFTDRSTVSNGRVSPAFELDAALLGVDGNGRPSGNAPSFVSNSLLSLDPANPRPAVLGAGPALVAKSGIGASGTRMVPFASPLRTGEEVFEWAQAPNASWHVVQTSARTLVLGSLNSVPKREFPVRSFYGVFSNDSRYFAAVSRSESTVRWFVADATGAMIREGDPTLGEISQLQLSPEGRFLTFNRQPRPARGVQTIAVNLASGEETILAVPAGTRYYSADGRTMAVLVPYPGALHLFDVSDPLHPAELASPYQRADQHFITAAVAPNGSLVGLQLIEPEDNLTKSLTRVVVLDRTLAERAVAARRTTVQGLQFEEQYLFLGIQRHPIPAWLPFKSTTRIQAFDLSGL